MQIAGNVTKSPKFIQKMHKIMQNVKYKVNKYFYNKQFDKILQYKLQNNVKYVKCHYNLQEYVQKEEIII